MISVKIERQTFRSLDDFILKSKEISNALMETATEIVQDVAGGGPHAAPIRQGHLRASYYAELLEPFKARVANNLGIAPYAIYVEFGTRKMSPKPHLRPAAEAARPRLIERVKEILV
jgi:HK97 gp10 family phage protein